MPKQVDGINVYCAYDEMMDTVALVPNPRNPNQHPEKQIELLAKIIKNQGWRAPITISNRSGFIVRGHGRLMAAKKLGLSQVPVDRQDYANEAEEWADLIADNKISELSQNDDAMLKDLLQELDTGAFDMDLTGFDDKELEKLMTQFHIGEVQEDDFDAEKAAAEIKEPVSKPGQIWKLGRHRIMCGDSTVVDDVNKLLAGEKAEMVFTDPPYGVNIKGGKSASGDMLRIAGDLSQVAIPFSFDLAVKIATTEDARFYFCGGEGNIILYSKLFDRFLNQLPRHLIWVKENFVMKPNGYHNQYEIIFHGYKSGGGALNKWYGERTEDAASDIWKIHRDKAKDYQHPTQKPVALPLRAITNSCKKGGLVYEPFSGSGSTIIAAEQSGRVCYAMEIDPVYVDVAILRFEQFTGQKAELLG